MWPDVALPFLIDRMTSARVWHSLHLETVVRNRGVKEWEEYNDSQLLLPPCAIWIMAHNKADFPCTKVGPVSVPTHPLLSRILWKLFKENSNICLISLLLKRLYIQNMPLCRKIFICVQMPTESNLLTFLVFYFK